MVADCVWFAIPQPTEWQRLGNQIDATFIFAGAICRKWRTFLCYRTSDGIHIALQIAHSFGVHHAITPDPYRGLWGRDDVDAGKKYAADVKNLIDYGTSGHVATHGQSTSAVNAAAVWGLRGL